MVQSRSDEGKAYRARKKADMGDVEYKAEQARKKREYRARQRAARQTEHKHQESKKKIQSDENDIKEIVGLLNNFLNKDSKLDMSTVRTLVEQGALPTLAKLKDSQSCDSIFEAVFAARGKLIYEMTKYKKSPKKLNKKSFKRNTWANMIKIYKKIYNKNSYDCLDVDWLKDHGKVIKFIKKEYEGKPNSIITIIASLSSITSVLEGFEDAYRGYSNVSTDLRVDKTKIDDENLTTAKERKNILPWTELRGLYTNQELNDRERALIGLYTLIPPRRIELAGLLTLVYSDKDLDSDFNYLVVDKETNDPIKIVMLKYKTANIYGRYEIKLPKTLKAILKEHIEIENLRDYDAVFGTRAGRYYKNFNPVLAAAFKKATGKVISVNLLRHSKISHHRQKQRSLAEKKALAKQMGHSVHISERYVRLDLK
jgi:hypothetical protein